MRVGLAEGIKIQQELVNLIKENSDKDGVCHLSEIELACKLGKSQTRISQMIDQINFEETCIKRVSGGYTLNFEDLTTQGTFYHIRAIYALFEVKPDSLKQKENDIAQMFLVQRKTVQKAKAYWYADHPSGKDR